MDELLGLSDRDKELRKWNQPYVYREFPKMLYRGLTTAAGKIELEQRIVGSEREETDAAAMGWLPPTRAREAEIERQQALGTQAAERGWDDRRMSPAAQAEAAALEQATLKHLPEIPERPKRRHRKRQPNPTSAAVSE